MTDLDEKQVVDFLQHNHDFLQKHPDLFSGFSIFHEPQGTTSLVRKQHSLLENKNQELKNKLAKLIEQAKNTTFIQIN